MAWYGFTIHKVLTARIRYFRSIAGTAPVRSGDDHSISKLHSHDVGVQAHDGRTSESGERSFSSIRGSGRGKHLGASRAKHFNCYLMSTGFRRASPQSCSVVLELFPPPSTPTIIPLYSQKCPMLLFRPLVKSSTFSQASRQALQLQTSKASFTTSVRAAMATEFKLKDLTSINLKNGQKQEVEVEGIEGGKVLLAKVKDQVHAMSSNCTHYGAPLVKGVLTGDGRITCPWHGGEGPLTSSST